MASDAKTLLPRTRRAAQQITAPQPNTETHAYRTWPGLLLLGTAVFAFFSVLTQGLFLFDNDYDWIAYAGAEWTNILGRIFRPIPTTWGFQERPVQELCFKILSTAFGYSATPYYAFKGLSLAGTTCGIALFCLRAGLTRQIAFSAAALFALSGPVFPSALWVS
ncbi:MAG: hypothetical protein O2954_14065, partial [bacterium]|nr:hypothetical protein [bacterium]